MTELEEVALRAIEQVILERGNINPAGIPLSEEQKRRFQAARVAWAALAGLSWAPTHPWQAWSLPDEWHRIPEPVLHRARVVIVATAADRCARSGEGEQML